MQHARVVTRRDVLKGSIAGAAMAAMATSGCAMRIRKGMDGNRQFYKPDGSFCAESAKKACFSMMTAFGYPIQDVLKTDQFWVCDFVQRDFCELGMGGIFWINEKGVYGQSGAKAYTGKHKAEKFGYLGHEIYLLPGQMLPEHSHIDNDGYGPKMEAWHVRYGTVQFFGEYKGAGDETPISKMPEAERPWGHGQPWFRSKYVAKRTARSGQLYVLKDPTSWHFQRAGAEGAIVTEYATYHNHVQFSKPGMEFAGSKAKG